MMLAMSQIAWAFENECKALEVLQQSGFVGLEIAPTIVAGTTPYKHIDIAAEFAARVQNDYALKICSMQSIWYGQTGSMFGEERQQLLAYTKEAILFAQAAGAGNLVFGNPKNRVLPHGKTPAAAQPFFKELGDFAAAHNTVLGLEANPPLYATNFMNATPDALDMARLVDSVGCRVNLDFGTIIINQEDVGLLCGRVHEISHVHISEPQLALIQPRDGHKKLAALLREEGYKGYVSVEMKQQPLEDVKRAAAYVAGVFA